MWWTLITLPAHPTRPHQTDVAELHEDMMASVDASESFKLIAERHEILRAGEDYAHEGAPQPPAKDFDARLPSRLRALPTLYRMTDREFAIRKMSFHQEVDMELISAFFEVK